MLIRELNQLAEKPFQQLGILTRSDGLLDVRHNLGREAKKVSEKYLLTVSKGVPLGFQATCLFVCLALTKEQGRLFDALLLSSFLSPFDLHSEPVLYLGPFILELVLVAGFVKYIFQFLMVRSLTDHFALT